MVNGHKFTGQVLSYVISLDQILGLVISEHFANDQNEFSSIILPTIELARKITILETILAFEKYARIKQTHTTIIGDLNRIKDERNKIAHWHHDIFENMNSSKKKKKDITLTKYEKGKLKSKKITEKMQKNLIEDIRKSSFALLQIHQHMQQINKTM